MKRKTLLGLIAIMVAVAMLLTGCRVSTEPAPSQSEEETTSESSQTSEETAPAERQVLAQGITDDEILIGTTFGNSGVYAVVGVPALAAFEAVLLRANANGGIGGRDLILVHYDDAFDAANGKALTEKLVEEDKVFALGLQGAHVVINSLDYIKDYGIPLVYMATGLGLVFDENAPGSGIFPVQPSAIQDSKFIVSRLFHEAIFGPNRDEKLPDDIKVGVLYVNSDSGNEALVGIMNQAAEEGKAGQIMAEAVTEATYATAIQKFKDAGVGAVISLSIDMKGIIAAMEDTQYEVPVFAGYGSSSLTAWAPETYRDTRPCFTTCWADYSTDTAKEALKDFYDALQYANVDDATKEAYRENNYARAGYVAAIVLVEGLQRLEDSGMDYSWENYITAMEQDEFNLITGSPVDFSNGQRLGTVQEAVFEYYAEDGVMKSDTVRPFETIEEIMAK